MSENHHIEGYVFLIQLKRSLSAPPKSPKSMSDISTSWVQTELKHGLLSYYYGSVNSKHVHPPRAFNLSGICHLVGPGSGDLSENLYPGVWHLSICLEEGNVILFSIVSLKNMSQKLNIQIKL